MRREPLHYPTMCTIIECMNQVTAEARIFSNAKTNAGKKQLRAVKAPSDNNQRITNWRNFLYDNFPLAAITAYVMADQYQVF